MSNEKDMSMPIVSEKLVTLDGSTDNLKRENNIHSVFIDPVLIDITNQDISNNTQYEILQEMACQDLQIYTDKMVNQMNKGMKRIKEYQIRDLVRVAVPKIDRFSVDRPTLPYKIIKKTKNDKYGLGTKFGIIEICYAVS